MDPSTLRRKEELPRWAQAAFSGVSTFNAVQSRVFETAFFSSKNLLVCAPTGAGKTNIALLTLLQQLDAHRHLRDKRPRPQARENKSAEEAESAPSAAPSPGEEAEPSWQPPSPRFFKAVYIAPMKSLAAEVAAKFAAALTPLGVSVSELTADIPLSKKDLEGIHVLVTVPEKLDLLTRSAAQSASAASADGGEGFLSLVKLIVIDEIHLLNEDRGPVLEALVARTLMHMERTQVMTRLVGISATLPNW